MKKYEVCCFNLDISSIDRKVLLVCYDGLKEAFQHFSHAEAVLNETFTFLSFTFAFYVVGAEAMGNVVSKSTRRDVTPVTYLECSVTSPTRYQSGIQCIWFITGREAKLCVLGLNTEHSVVNQKQWLMMSLLWRSMECDGLSDCGVINI